MYAIVEIAGQQFKVSKDQEIFVHRLEGDAGSPVDFENVLLLDHDGNITIGAPTVNGAVIKGKIVEHLKGDKVLVFHKKRRKGYQKQTGHRQYLSKVLIEDILTGEAKSTQTGAAKKTRVKKEESTEADVPKKRKAATAVADEKIVEPDTFSAETQPGTIIDENAGSTKENKTE